MFINDRLIYLQMHKTGCTHITKLLDLCVGGKEVGLHNTLENYETDKFILGSVRNPWDWYVSLWAFGCSQRGGIYKSLVKKNYLRAFKNILTDFDFTGMRKIFTNWEKLYKDSENPVLFRRWLKNIYDRDFSGQFPEGYAGHPTSRFIGLMTYRYAYFFIKNFLSDQGDRFSSFKKLEEFERDNNILDGIIITDNLEKDFLKALESAGYEIDDKIFKIVNDFGQIKSNTSKHMSTGFYYDDETMNLVANNEKLIIDKYRFIFPGWY